MKFQLEKSCSNGRLGLISDVERLPTFTLDTPNLLFYTKRGCIPHLTYDVQQMLMKEALPIQFPLDNVFNFVDVIQQLKTNLNTFVGLPEHLSYTSVQDPTVAIPQGYHKRNTATVWTGSGKIFVDREKYMEVMETLQPDMYVTLSDGDTKLPCSMKRLCNSAYITNDAFDYCYNKHASSSLKNKGLIAPIEGGYNKSIRERCATYMTEYPVLGYLIDGLYTDGKNVNDIPFKFVEEIVQHTVKILQEDRIRIIHGAWSPKSVLKLVKMGIDLFDTSFPCILSEKGCALMFNYNIKHMLEDDSNLYDDSEINLDFEEIVDADSKISVEKQESTKPLYISLNDTRYFEDMNPILENCSCLTCKNHTRAYVHHLLVAKELLAPVLLTIHNLHHYMSFFKRIRQELSMSS